ncbi:flagellar basal body P-ring formation chaperone FlgA [Pseudooceanicola aestuarii]|uniref:flagellar basal body P-ring formation chaperone FlgA n=1 Tax=Pseudooceanicola aestuarii TaxID=2697319 RepID=UPI0013D38C98|nr:flagellar basal body P-ring formation chaperone FlgA [Pseudooceanicola aestuarii]
MRRFLIPALMLVLAIAGPATAATPETLVEERARAEWGAQLPEGAEIRVRVNGRRPEDAVMFSDYWMDRKTGQFLANAVLENGQVQRIGGLVWASIAVPVTTRRLMPGEILRDADLDDLDLPLNRVGAYTVVDRTALVGMQVRRMLPQGRPVMQQSVIKPLVITRGDRIEIVFDDGQVRVSAPGRSLEDAHRGQELRIVNLVSNRSLVGMATEPGLVEIVR